MEVDVCVCVGVSAHMLDAYPLSSSSCHIIQGNPMSFMPLVSRTFLGDDLVMLWNIPKHLPHS